MIYLIITSTLATFLLTYMMRCYALKKNIIDTPNGRSSHTIPTPRGGGVSVVVVSLAIMFGWGLVDASFYWLALASIVVGAVGFLDDRGDIRPKVRLIAHFAAAYLVVYGVGGLPALVMFGTTVDLGLFGNILAVIGVVWLLNLYNFMDGIDGLASIEAITSMLVLGALMLFVLGALTPLVQVHFLLAATVFGFFLWNFPRARIFMGDAGSGYLGTIVAAMMLASAQYAQEFFWAWLIMLGVFIVDATFTLLRRLARGDKVHVAHRSHAYQWASRKYGSHVPVTLSVLLINIFWLAPWALAVAQGLVDGLVGLIVAYIPLLALAVLYKSGAKEA